MVSNGRLFVSWLVYWVLATMYFWVFWVPMAREAVQSGNETFISNPVNILTPLVIFTIVGFFVAWIVVPRRMKPA
mgnify:CR=1 FL=1